MCVKRGEWEVCVPRIIAPVFDSDFTSLTLTLDMPAQSRGGTRCLVL